jgi:proline racemase
VEAIRVSTVDYHTAGEPFRIVLDGGPTIPGASVLERRETAATRPEIDRIRQLLVQEPRGHADMYGCFIVPPNDDDADLGVLFWHKDGYSTACGHGTIALGAWAVESGRVGSDHDGETVVSIDAPSGRVRARVNKRAGVVTDVAFENVGSFAPALDVPVETSRGSVTVDIGYGGAFYASLPAAAVELSVSPADHDALVAIGREIKWALHDSEWVEHPSDDRLGGLYGTIWYDDLGRSTEAGPHHG